MNEAELRRVEQDLRDVVIGSPLEWVLEEVDDAVDAGVPEEKVLRRRSQRGSNSEETAFVLEAVRYETLSRAEVGDREFSLSDKKGTVVVTTRPMTAEERLRLFYDALRRVLVDLPEIEENTLDTLGSVPEEEQGERVQVISVRFADSGEGARGGEREIQLSRRAVLGERQRLAYLLAGAIEEIRL